MFCGLGSAGEQVRQQVSQFGYTFFFFVELSRWDMCRMWFGCVLSKSAKTYLKETSSEWLCMFVPNL